MFFELWVVGISTLVLLFLIDDLVIDLVAFFNRLGPKEISLTELQSVNKDLKLSIMIANWQESEVLGHMVKGNFSNLDENTHVFLGVYPNDTETKNLALNLSSEFSNVHVVINHKNGPTYKGQMLNCVLENIFKFEKEKNINFNGFILHDSEDVLDSKLLDLYRIGLKDHDFIQTPVASLPLRFYDFVGGTYLDEFVEMHHKELLVRQHLKASIPSAGVGTCLARSLILAVKKHQEGSVFLPNSLTEDYNLGLLTKDLGFKSKYFCVYPEGSSLKKIIATKEYFPNEIWPSIKQKTRWVTGISYQGYENFGWRGGFWEHYFLWRDRRGPISALIVTNSFLILLSLILKTGEVYFNKNLVFTLMFINLCGIIYKAVLRVFLVTKATSLKEGLLSIIRWPFSILINTVASFRSTKEYYLSKFSGKQISWSKTKHRIPKALSSSSKN